MFLVVDCKDSFVFNLSSALESLGAEVTVVDEDSFPDCMAGMPEPEAVVLSPGPGRPDPSRGSWKAFLEFRDKVPVLGVCLGHQTVCAASGASLTKGRGPMHGKIVPVSHDGGGILNGIPDGFRAVRYNSLCVDPSTLKEPLKVDAVDGRGDIMAVSHRDLPVFGVQFHPESFMTEHGKDILRNFISEVRS